MFEAVCRDLSEWIRTGERVIKVACNFSRLHFAREDVAERLKEIADAYRVPYEYLEIEITESAFMDDSKNIIDQMKNCGKSVSRRLSMISAWGTHPSVCCRTFRPMF